MGTPTISGQILKSLYQNGFDIEVVYTQPPVASNRGYRLNSDSLNFIIEIMNRTKLISLRNELLLEILPLKV